MTPTWPPISTTALASRVKRSDWRRLGGAPGLVLAVSVTLSRPSPWGTVATPTRGRGAHGPDVGVAVGVRVGGTPGAVGVLVGVGGAVGVLVGVGVAVAVCVGVAMLVAVGVAVGVGVGV